MTLSQELEAARVQVRLYQGALRRIRRTCKHSEESDAEIREYCYHHANAALIKASQYRPGDLPLEAGAQAGADEAYEAAS